MEETIAAISTPPGEGGIGIIRISGPDAEKILDRIFSPASKSAKENGHFRDHLLNYGWVKDPKDGQVIDEVLAVYMKAPRTYTAEDVCEIDCHGGFVAVRRTLEAVLACGAKPADPGEFTERAFLNGRLDLTQAEAVMDLIDAKADRGYEAALGQLEGGLSQKIREIRSDLMDILVQVTVNIDYPDEDIEQVENEKLDAGLKAVCGKIEKLLKSAETGRIVRDGLKVAIIGKPNVGKSSLMNRLLRETRAIVTEIPGTTRDTIRENLSIQGIPVILIDTAGIRETDDRIESIGIEKSIQSLRSADLVIYVADASRKISPEDMEIAAALPVGRTIAVMNKTDLPLILSKSDIDVLLPGAEVIEASMKDGEGISEIEDSIVRRVYGGSVSADNSVLITNARQKELLERALADLKQAGMEVRTGEPLEILDINIHEGYDLLGEIIGESVSDDVLNEVFSRFCLGK